MSLRRQTVTQLKRDVAENSDAAAEVENSPLYGVAMLKIAMELKKADSGPVDELIRQVLERMRLSEPEFRAFLNLNGGLLRTLAQRQR